MLTAVISETTPVSPSIKEVSVSLDNLQKSSIDKCSRNGGEKCDSHLYWRDCGRLSGEVNFSSRTSKLFLFILETDHHHRSSCRSGSHPDHLHPPPLLLLQVDRNVSLLSELSSCKSFETEISDYKVLLI